MANSPPKRQKFNASVLNFAQGKIALFKLPPDLTSDVGLRDDVLTHMQQDGLISYTPELDL
jgi:hypothetical protein